MEVLYSCWKVLTTVQVIGQGFVNNSQQGLQLDFDNDKLDKLETNGKTIILVLDLKKRKMSIYLLLKITK
jgi:hypothetical protein